MNEWKRKFVIGPHRTISGKIFFCKNVWWRLINEIGTKKEYELDPDGLETQFVIDNTKPAKWTDILGIVESELKPKKDPWKSSNQKHNRFTDILREYRDSQPLTEGPWKTSTKVQLKGKKPTKPPAPAQPKANPNWEKIKNLGSAITFSTDGLKMCVKNQQYNLSTAWKVSTATPQVEAKIPIGQIVYDARADNFKIWTGETYIKFDPPSEYNPIHVPIINKPPETT